jgi:hypothetical protein
LHAPAQVPSFTSVTAAGGTQQNAGNAIAVDSAGNSYIAGSFGFQNSGGTLNLATTNLVSLGNSDGFLAKFDAQGRCLWARQMAGPDKNDAYDVILRSDGTVLVTGEFVGTNAIGNTNLMSQGDFDIFLAAFNPGGDLLWARSIGGTLDDFAIALAAGPNGSAFFTGSFAGDINLGSGIAFSSADDDALLIKLDVSGNAQWARAAGGEGFQLGSDVKVDSQGNVFWAGEFETNVVFSSTNFSSPGFNVFLAMYDAAGTRLWTRKLGDGEHADLPRIALAGDGRLLCSAAYIGQYAIAGQGLPAGLNDVLLASFASSGALQWVRTFGGSEPDVCTDLLIDGEGGCWVLGHFRGTITIGSTNLTSTGSTDVFVARCNANGEPQYALKGGGVGADLAFSGTVGPAGEVRLAGSFSSTAQFGSISVSSSDLRPKMFIATVDQPPRLHITSTPGQVLLSWPGHFAGYTLESKTELSAPSWAPVGGQPVLVDGELVVTNETFDPARFFRLRN